MSWLRIIGSRPTADNRNLPLSCISILIVSLFISYSCLKCWFKILVVSLAQWTRPKTQSPDNQFNLNLNAVPESRISQINWFVIFYGLRSAFMCPSLYSTITKLLTFIIHCISPVGQDLWLSGSLTTQSCWVAYYPWCFRASWRQSCLCPACPLWRGSAGNADMTSAPTLRTSSACHRLDSQLCVFVLLFTSVWLLNTHVPLQDALVKEIHKVS